MPVPLKGTGWGRMCKIAPLCCLNLTDSHPSLFQCLLWRRAHSPGTRTSYDERGERFSHLSGSFSLSLWLSQQRMFLLKSEKCWPQEDKCSVHRNALNQAMSQLWDVVLQPNTLELHHCPPKIQPWIRKYTESSGNWLWHLSNITPSSLSSLAQLEISKGSVVPR